MVLGVGEEVGLGNVCGSVEIPVGAFIGGGEVTKVSPFPAVEDPVFIGIGLGIGKGVGDGGEELPVGGVAGAFPIIHAAESFLDAVGCFLRHCLRIVIGGPFTGRLVVEKRNFGDGGPMADLVRQSRSKVTVEGRGSATIVSLESSPRGVGGAIKSASVKGGSDEQLILGESAGEVLAEDGLDIETVVGGVSGVVMESGIVAGERIPRTMQIVGLGINEVKNPREGRQFKLGNPCGAGGGEGGDLVVFFDAIIGFEVVQFIAQGLQEEGVVYTVSG